MPNPGQELATLDFESMLGGPLVAVVNAQAQAAVSTVNFIKEIGFKKVKDEQNPDTGIEVGEPIYATFKYPKEISPFQPGTSNIAAITLTNGGTGYTTAPAVAISGGGGSGAGATATVTGGAVSGINLTSAGSGYTSTPTVTLSGGGGTGATATAQLSPPGAPTPAQIQEMKLEVPLLTMVPIPFIRVDLTTIDFNAKINSVEYRKTDTSIKVDAALEAKAGWLWGSAKLKVSTAYQRNTQQGISVDRTYSMAVHIKAVQDEIPAGMEKVLGILEDAIRGQPAKAPPPTNV
jgi:hypothetical protein